MSYGGWLPYGADFRRLTPADKQPRRRVLTSYSTCNAAILPTNKVGRNATCGEKWGVKDELNGMVKHLFRLIKERWAGQFGVNAPILPRWQRILWCWIGTAAAVMVFLVGNDNAVASMKRGRSADVEAIRQVSELWYTDPIFFVSATAVLSLIPAIAFGNSFIRGTPFVLILFSISSTAILIGFLQTLLN